MASASASAIEALEAAVAAAVGGEVAGASCSTGSPGGSGSLPLKASEPVPSSSAAIAAAETATGKSDSRGRSRSRSPHGGEGRSDTSRERRHRRHRESSKYRFSHILIKHEHSRRPKDYNHKQVTRTKDEAMLLAIEVHEKLTKDLITFADAAVSFSDCRPSQPSDGDAQPNIETGKLVRSFKTVALNLAPGEISNVIESTSGFHILQRRE